MSHLARIRFRVESSRTVTFSRARPIPLNRRPRRVHSVPKPFSIGTPVDSSPAKTIYRSIPGKP